MLIDQRCTSNVAQRLLDPQSFQHEVNHLQLLETHISWVILTGTFAYKIKKPINFDFVDYSTPSLRRRYCRLEVELNRRFAPELYLGVVPIYERDGVLVVGNRFIEQWEKESSVIAVEHAVKMREFSQDSIVAARLRNPELTPTAVADFGVYLARFHESIESNPPTSDCGHPKRIEKDALDNFSTLSKAFQFGERCEQVKKLKRWSVSQLAKLPTKFSSRLRSGKIRRCHGDLHLKNMIQLDGQLMAFDGIEFNEQFQWIDVLSEIAFPVMDFVARDRADLGWRLLNSYLESTGDDADLDVLRFYLVYRAMVRAKVTWLNPSNHSEAARMKYSVDDSHVDEYAGPWDKYLNAAACFAFELEPSISITHGFSGSGKSTIAMQLVEKQGGVRIRSDVKRQQLVTELNLRDKYSPETSDRVYLQLLELARSAVAAGMPIVIDATFLERRRRSLFEILAKKTGVEFRIIDCDAPFDELCQRIQSRGDDPSDATLDVLKMQMKTHDPLTTDELRFIASSHE